MINHSTGVYVEGDIHTNTIEGFFGNLKTGMRGTYKHVSRKWLQSYLDEYAWRHNERNRGQRSMFHHLLEKAANERPEHALNASAVLPETREGRPAEARGDRGPTPLLPEAQEAGVRSPGLLLRPVFPARAFTTCWRSDLRNSRVELTFGRDRDLQSLVGFLLRLALVSHQERG